MAVSRRPCSVAAASALSLDAVSCPCWKGQPRIFGRSVYFYGLELHLKKKKSFSIYSPFAILFISKDSVLGELEVCKTV